MNIKVYYYNSVESNCSVAIIKMKYLLDKNENEDLKLYQLDDNVKFDMQFISKSDKIILIGNCFKVYELERLFSMCDNIIIINNDDVTIQNINGLNLTLDDNKIFLFDVNKTCIQLVWDYLFEYDAPDTLKNLFDIKSKSYCLFKYGIDLYNYSLIDESAFFSVWFKLLKNDVDFFNEICQKGDIIYTYLKKYMIDNWEEFVKYLTFDNKSCIVFTDKSFFKNITNDFFYLSDQDLIINIEYMFLSKIWKISLNLIDNSNIINDTHCGIICEKYGNDMKFGACGGYGDKYQGVFFVKNLPDGLNIFNQ